MIPGFPQLQVRESSFPLVRDGTESFCLSLRMNRASLRVRDQGVQSMAGIVAAEGFAFVEGFHSMLFLQHPFQQVLITLFYGRVRGGLER